MTPGGDVHALGWRSWSVIAVAVAFLLGLGTWQMQRKAWKEELLNEIGARAALSPLTQLKALPMTSNACSGCEYRRLALSGRFIAGTERHVFISVPMQAGGIGGPGYWVFQVFEADDVQVYVNRGFVPEAQKSTPLAAERRVDIEGILRLPEARGRFSNANDVQRNVYYVRSPDEFDYERHVQQRSATATAPRHDLYIDMTGPVPSERLPLPMVGKIAIPNRHLEYALTWYALAATLLAVAVAMNRR